MIVTQDRAQMISACMEALISFDNHESCFGAKNKATPLVLDMGNTYTLHPYM